MVYYQCLARRDQPRPLSSLSAEGAQRAAWRSQASSIAWRNINISSLAQMILKVRARGAPGG